MIVILRIKNGDVSSVYSKINFLAFSSLISSMYYVWCDLVPLLLHESSLHFFVKNILVYYFVLDCRSSKYAANL